MKKIKSKIAIFLNYFFATVIVLAQLFIIVISAVIIVKTGQYLLALKIFVTVIIATYFVNKVMDNYHKLIVTFRKSSKQEEEMEELFEEFKNALESLAKNLQESIKLQEEKEKLEKEVQSTKKATTKSKPVATKKTSKKK